MASRTNISILHSNVRSLNKNLSPLLSFIVEQGKSFEIIATTETWLKKNENITIPGYTTLSQPRNSQFRGGGVAMFVTDSLHYTILSSVSSCSPELEALFLKLEWGLVVGVVYRPPSSSLTMFFDKLEIILSSLAKNYKNEVIIVGDVNIDTLSRNTMDYTYLLQSYNFRNLINSPTRITTFSATSIDHALTNIDTGAHAGVYQTPISDHLPIFVNVDTPPAIKENKSRTDIKLDYESFRKKLLLLNTDLIYHEDVNIEFSNLITTLVDLIKNSSRSTTASRRYKPICPWMTEEILNVLKKKDYWYHKWLHHRSNQYYLYQFKCARNKSVSLMRARKKEYFARRIKAATGNSKEMWQIVNEATHNFKKRSVLPSNITEQTVEDFNTFFTKVGPDLASKLPDISTSSDLPRPVLNSFFLHEVELTEVMCVVMDLVTNKAAGYDGIPVKVIKENIDVLGPILCHLFNHSILNSTYPSSLKIARVTPVFKDGDSSDPSSYRPISVLSVINTIFEKILNKRIHQFLQKYNIICPEQHGFRPQYSTSSAVMTLTQAINDALHNNRLAAVIFLDIKKAFDTVNHDIMLNKLKIYGLRDKVLDFFSSYLTNRQQIVSMKSLSSSIQRLLTGVPQGSTLGPLLFLLYVNDLPKVLTSSKAIMYADDTAIVVTAHHTVELENIANTELEKISDWFLTNKLTINAKKTKYILFHSKKKSILSSDITLTINQTQLESTNTFTYLGVTLDKHLHWQHHIEATCTKMASGCYALLQTREYFDTNILRVLYFTLIHTHLSYCIESWGWTYSTYLEPIKKLQKRALRIISFSSYTAHSKALFTKLRVLPLNLLREKRTAECVYKIVTNNLPFDISIFNIPPLSTRSRTYGNFNLPVKRNVYGERLLEFTGAKIWNNLPHDLKTAYNFSIGIKNYYLIKNDTL